MPEPPSPEGLLRRLRELAMRDLTRSCITLALASWPLQAAGGQATRDAKADSVSATRRQPAFCWRPGRERTCRTWLLVEAGIYKEMKRSVRSLSPPRDVASAFGPHGTWEFGALRNVDRLQAIGAAGIIGFGGGGFVRHGLRVRYRRWLWNQEAIDVAMGPVWVDARGVYARAPVLSTDIRYSHADMIALTGRVDLVDQAGFARGSSVYGGVTFASRSALVATLVAAVGTVIGVMVAAAAMN